MDYEVRIYTNLVKRIGEAGYLLSLLYDNFINLKQSEDKHIVLDMKYLSENFLISKYKIKKQINDLKDLELLEIFYSNTIGNYLVLLNYPRILNLIEEDLNGKY